MPHGTDVRPPAQLVYPPTQGGPNSLRRSVRGARRGSSAAELLSAVRENRASLVTDPSRKLRSFRVAMTRPVGTKRGRGSFIDSALDGIAKFYADAVGNLCVWSGAPSKLRDRLPIPEDLDANVQPALESN